MIRYNALLNAYVECGAVDTAMEVYKTAQEQGIEFNTLTHSILIKGHLKNKDAQAAVEAFDNLKTSGFHPTVTTFNAIVQSLLENHRRDELLVVLEEMKNTGVVPRANLMNRIIVDLAKVETEETDDVVVHMWKQLKKRQLKPSKYSRQTFEEFVERKMRDTIEEEKREELQQLLKN
eukprot:TRINITY_DN14700_c0_g1_i1.p1 TRINITY_DN14700_c0_g1~~TRINITY_DN14700_c0_g1_i1.p1  ORF type:complete len:177 (+),score=81.07 TRINITY_DN14700_c0_g1_i1:81-611(+)